MTTPLPADSDARPDGALTIRLVTPGEYAEAGGVTAEAYRHSYDGLTEAYLASLADVAGRVAEGDVWVAVDPDGTILGTVWVPRPGERLSELAQDGELDFRQLAVAPAARGRGVGAALTRHVIDLARARGAGRIVMNSGPEMTGAHALYLKLGFRRLTEREHPIEVEPGHWIDLRAFGLDL
ncbi:GNAT family N-acetyltransferase [Microbacterium sp. RURRCA19A]|uniref:GNAT family N-acetyltransferase n=1 Tax=Microbacterium sp. RURRCA19A TaxID=1907391 RepID=UPI000956E490|nr:GNAT family N-acetyltransferase [Microbacterium sp. RURRCA19A]SIR91080.1 Predicted N-acetyltransferase YhbS [Microbacterium sp. RURRCA19A]